MLLMWTTKYCINTKWVLDKGGSIDTEEDSFLVLDKSQQLFLTFFHISNESIPSSLPHIDICIWIVEPMKETAASSVQKKWLFDSLDTFLLLILLYFLLHFFQMNFFSHQIMLKVFKLILNINVVRNCVYIIPYSTVKQNEKLCDMMWTWS